MSIRRSDTREQQLFYALEKAARNYRQDGLAIRLRMAPWYTLSTERSVLGILKNHKNTSILFHWFLLDPAGPLTSAITLAIKDDTDLPEYSIMYALDVLAEDFHANKLEGFKSYVRESYIAGLFENPVGYWTNNQVSYWNNLFGDFGKFRDLFDLYRSLPDKDARKVVVDYFTSLIS